MVEAFNAWILDAMCKPIITMLEEIKVMVMTRKHVKRTWAEKWRTNISSVALQKLEKNATTSTKCNLAYNGDKGFEVIHEDNQHTVDLKELKCTCREWVLTGIPCCHVVCAMYHDEKNPKAYASPWYNNEQYVAAYSQGEIFWLKRADSILPLPVKNIPGRPKKNRRKSKDEPKKSKFGKDTRRGLKMSCSLCKQVGHNKKLFPARSNMSKNLQEQNSNFGSSSMQVQQPQLETTMPQSAGKHLRTHNMEGKEKESSVSISQCITNAEGTKKEEEKTI
ncbi:transposase [Gossypium australe]|uniref:Transposase n=1 Tax=Gossypium australe TaxID=47621 RepID=A0A5B6WXE7_9ROSI|nr:transposase [Gossypium australe]